MMEENKSPIAEQYSLEELNRQFESNIKKKRKKKYKGILGIVMPVLLAVVVLIVILVIKESTGSQSTGESIKDTAAAKNVTNDEETDGGHKSILSEAEQEKWTAADLDEENIFVILNTKIYLDGNKAYIRLINPIYGTYYYSITIYPETEEDTILYQSEKIAPGTILEAAMLTAEPTEAQYAAVVKYQVYDEEGNELGTHPVQVEFTTDEQFK